MDSFEWNKIAGAILFALLLAFGLSIFSEIVFETEAPEEPGYVIASAESGEGGAAEAPEAMSIAMLMTTADAGAGAKSAKKCLACHTFGEGEANKVGPNLYGVLNRPIAGHEGYEYSDAMKAFAAENGTWTYEHLNTYLTNPAGTVPQTKMTFAGLKKDAERANVIAYLRSLSADPAPLPVPEATPAEEDAAAAEPAADDAAEEEQAAAEPAAMDGMAESAPMAAESDEPAAEAMAAAEETPAEPAAMTAEPEAMATAEPEAMTAAEPEAMAAAEPEAMASTEPMTAAEPEATPMTAAEPATEDTMEEQVATAEEPAAMPAGDVAKGKKYAKRCLACHTFNEGGGKKVGPPLFGVFGRTVASVPDFNYSDGMTAFSDGGTRVWDAETLNTYLADPRHVVKGTKMAFPGVKDADRADVIAYLASLK